MFDLLPSFALYFKYKAVLPALFASFTASSRYYKNRELQSAFGRASHSSEKPDISDLNTHLVL